MGPTTSRPVTDRPGDGSDHGKPGHCPPARWFRPRQTRSLTASPMVRTTKWPGTDRLPDGSAGPQAALRLAGGRASPDTHIRPITLEGLPAATQAAPSLALAMAARKGTIWRSRIERRRQRTRIPRGHHTRSSHSQPRPGAKRSASTPRRLRATKQRDGRERVRLGREGAPLLGPRARRGEPRLSPTRTPQR